KMNSLDALLDLAARVDVEDDDRLAAFHPRTYDERFMGRTVADVGGEPILHMRGFQKSGHIPAELRAQVLGRPT
ncbi:MAG: hypothetical protein ACK6CU_25200, partial [Deltaproteobacteria bacterium]